MRDSGVNMNKNLLLFLLLSFGAFSQTKKPLYLSPSQKTFELINYIEYFEDKSANLTIAEINEHGKFVDTHGNLAFGLSWSAFWLKFKVQNSETADNFILRLQDPGIDRILVYQSNQLIADIGDKYPFYERTIIDKDFAIRLPLQKNQTAEYIIRIEKKGQTLSIPIQLFREDYFHQFNKNEYMFWGIFWGVALAFILLNLLTFLNFRERMFLYSSAYILFFVTYCTTGLGYEYLWYNFPHVGNYDSGIVATTTVSFHILFIQAFINQQLSSNKILFYANRITVFTLLFGCLLAIIAVITKHNLAPLGHQIATIFMEISMPIYIILVITNIYDGFKRKQTGMKYIISSVLAVAFSMMTNVLIKLGWVYLPFASVYLVPFGVLIDSLIITYAQTKRFNIFARERNQYLSELIESKNQILQTQETERRRLAQDLHDDLGGTLSAIKGRIANEAVHLETIHLVEKAIEDLRLVSRNLMPPELTNEGLVKAIFHTIERLQNASKIEFTYIPFGKVVQLSEEKELNIYRIVAELLNNIVKHSKATKAIIQLVYYNNYLLISLEDNGIGINTNENTWGIGLKNINSRVEFMKAKIITDSSIKGTTFIIEVPYV